VLDKQLINAIAADGIPPEDAEDMAKRVFAAVRALLDDGKTVGIPDIGRLRAPSKVAKAGFPPDFLREQRKVELRHGAMVEQGEPYPDPRAAPRKRSTYGGGR
jgi:nucleoid DNA-binding protein